ncbi:hypothetical protein N7474_010348 [Penicillium riverlandense]|uniref:uncharacterized protein n=1 Tax=Penicillium riverlandense TaxID=1903569 RepID=UPI002546F441|nr:uncharacterized protein N7474_010348 [Penicillium riverlandense]KAJ5806756.1 hypothetical protein N7474_010348 [Penicillium riverlandense]
MVMMVSVCDDYYDCKYRISFSSNCYYDYDAIENPCKHSRSGNKCPGGGDVLAQQAVDRRGLEKHDFGRTGRMALYGGAIFGPAATTWFGILQRHVVLKGTTSTTVARVAADQMLFAPVNLTCFLSSMAIMEGSDPVEKLRSAWLPSYQANLMVWPFVQGANFAFVPLELRVLVVNVVSLGE